MKNKTLIIFGSSRSDGNTRIIADFLVDKIPADLMNLSDYEFSYFDYDYKNQNDDYLALAKQLLDYENLVFCTPVYWYSMSGIMKTFFDRMTDLLKFHKPIGRGLAGKKMFAICCSSDEEEYDGFFMPFEKTAGYLDMQYGGNVHSWIENSNIPEAVLKRLIKFSETIGR